MIAPTEKFSIQLPGGEKFELPEGARSTIDYRSLIHDEVHKDYGGGASRRNFDYRDFFAASDAMLDAEEALYFALRSEWPENICERYLWLYGGLQALVIQQDCVIRILKCFDQESGNFFDAVSHIRDIRVSVAGHPARHDRKQLKLRGSTYLSRQALEQGKFSAVTYPDDGGFKIQSVDVVELIEEQSIAVNKALAPVWTIVNDWMKS